MFLFLDFLLTDDFFSYAFIIIVMFSALNTYYSRIINIKDEIKLLDEEQQAVKLFETQKHTPLAKVTISVEFRQNDKRKKKRKMRKLLAVVAFVYILLIIAILLKKTAFLSEVAFNYYSNVVIVLSLISMGILVIFTFIFNKTKHEIYLEKLDDFQRVRPPF